MPWACQLFLTSSQHCSLALCQIEEEIAGCLEFLQSVYSTFGFSFELHLATRPTEYLGEAEMWDKAEVVSEALISGFCVSSLVFVSVGLLG